MPNIVEYTNRENISPTDRGVEARVQEGRRIGASFNQQAESLRDFANRTGHQISGAIRDAGDAAVQYADHQQISRGSAGGMQILADLTNEWNQTAKNADPNDPSVAPKFLEQRVGPTLDKFREGFTTEKSQQWAEHFIEGVRNHLYEKTTADMSSMAGMAITGNLHKITNTGANTAMQDPSSVPFLLDNVDHIVDGILASSPNLKAGDAARIRAELTQKIKETYVKAGAQGAVLKSNDPEKTAQEWPQKYSQYITGNEAYTLGQNARTAIRARDYDQRSAAYYKKQEETEASNEAVGEYIGKIYNTNPRIAGDPIAQQMLNDGRLTKADRGNLMRLRERELKPETEKAISEQTSVGLLRELHAPNADPQKIMQKAWDARLMDAGKPGSLTSSDFNMVRKEIEDRKTPKALALQQDRAEFFKRYASALDPAVSAGLESPAGSQARYRAEIDARRLERVLESKGQDPHSLYDPSSPNFFGKPENLGKYNVSLQEANKSRSDALKGNKQGVPALGANEDPGNFAERFGAAVTKKSDYDNLPPGATFRGADGKLYQKPFLMQVPVSK